MENEHEKRPVPYRMIVCIAAVAVVLAIYVVRLVDCYILMFQDVAFNLSLRYKKDASKGP